MKKKIILPAIISAITLTACGKNLGAKIKADEFFSKVNEIEQQEKITPFKVEAQGKAYYPEEKTDIDVSFAFNKPSLRAEEIVTGMIREFTIQRELNQSDGENPIYYFDKTTDDLSIEYSTKSYTKYDDGVVARKAHFKYSWNKYGYLTYMYNDIQENIKGTKYHSEVDVTISYIFEN